jgi:hypothetical protein
MKQTLLAIMLWLAIPAAAQTPTDSLPTAWRAASKTFWHAGIDYSGGATAGVSLVVGRERTTSIRGYSQLRGMIVTVESGLGGFGGRLGYARLFQYDAGTDGFSVEAVYMKPWLLRWGFHSGENYIGPGITYRFGYVKLSGAAMVSTKGSERQVRPSVSFGFAVPFTLKR